jgi:nicotinate-nucleotide adenylyltransferase
MQSLPPFGDRRRRRIGLLGGSFNPAHDGHLHISRVALKALGLDQVWWLVSPQNPLKPAKSMAPLTQRLSQARRVARDPRIVVTDVERRLGTTRTVATLRLLRRRYPRLEFVWLMGADNLAQMPRWWRWNDIFTMVRVAVLDRSPYSYRAHAGAAAQRYASARYAPRRLWTQAPPAWSYLAIRRHGASSTALRTARIKRKKETTIPASTASTDLARMVDVILKSLADDKAQDVLNIDLIGKTTIADRMIVASGTSGRMVSAMAQHLVTKLKGIGITPRSEGEEYGDWVCVDAGDVIVHLFRPEVRAFYDLERIWNTPVPTPVKKAEKTSRKPAKPRAKTAAKKAAPKSTAKAPRRKAAAKKPARR